MQKNSKFKIRLQLEMAGIKFDSQHNQLGFLIAQTNAQ